MKDHLSWFTSQNNCAATPIANHSVQSKEFSRRAFLRYGSAAVAGTSLLSHPVFAADTAPKKIRIGIIGGRFGNTFQFHEHPDCVVTAVSDLLPDRRAALMEHYQCRTSYHSLEELVLDKNVDAVFIATDGPLHTQHVEAAMRHGKHVLSAVPAAWGSLDDCHRLKDTVERYGLTYMMAETSYYQQPTISVRNFYQQGRFGELFYCQSEYCHPGGESLMVTNDGKRTWRYVVPPMNYPTHCTAHLIGVTGERLVDVTCRGWGDDDEFVQDNFYSNPFWNESAMFGTNRGHAFRVNIWWRAAVGGTERAEWNGSKMSFYAAHPNGLGPMIVETSRESEMDDAGYVRQRRTRQSYEQPNWWATDLLPEPLRHDSGHLGSHCFLTHEFIDALTHDRRPVVDVYEALAYTAPGIVAHQSALRGGEPMKIPSFDPDIDSQNTDRTS